MRYVFRLLVLGNPETAVMYISSAFEELGEDKEKYHNWYKELNVMDDICDLEINVITDLISTDFDVTIPSADGIIYFLNPLDEKESDYFKIVLPIISSVKRDIPTVIIYNHPDGILPVSANKLLENIWVKYPHLEAFINLYPHQFHQVLQCICSSMITGNPPLNIENAWMRFPIFIQLTNFFFKNKNYLSAAHAIKNLSIIADIYDKQETYIFSEQSAFLYSKLGLFLEASNVVENTDKKLSNLFKKNYAEKMIIEGNLLFNKKEYEKAALLYESAGQWASIELNDTRVVESSFELAVNSWISACKCDKGFQILERLPHMKVGPLLKNISNKIIAAIDFLVSINNLNAAKDQLYYTLFTYQRESLFEYVNKFAQKIIKILTLKFEESIRKEEVYKAKISFDEIENIWESFKIEKTNNDDILKKLIKKFLNKSDFGTATLLMNKLESLELKKTLSEYRIEVEEKNKKFRKEEVEDNVRLGLELLLTFVKKEHEIIVEINKQKIQEAEQFIEQNDWVKAAKHIKTQADFLREIGKEDIENQILTKSLDILLEGKFFIEFFEYIDNLSKDMIKKYLLRIYPIYLEKLKTVKKEVDFEKCDVIMEQSNFIYRDQGLYDESKEITQLYIDLLIEKSSRILINEKDLLGIDKALEMIMRIYTLSSAYLENINVNFDEIYKKITEIYIYNINDFSSAYAYNEKIENKAIRSKFHKEIAKLESKQSKLKVKAVSESVKGERLKEEMSIMKQKARDALQDRNIELKQRIGLKRAFFNEALNHLKNGELEKAIDNYMNSMLRLINLKKYNLASVSFAMACIILLNKGKIKEVLNTLKKEELSSSTILFSETFPVILIKYLIELKKIKKNDEFEEILLLMENLPLFDEENEYLYMHLGKKYQKEEKEIKDEKTSDIVIEPVKKTVKTERKVDKSSKQKIELEQVFAKLQQKKIDIKSDSKDFLVKRKAMRRRYYNKILDLLKNRTFKEASISYRELTETLAKRNDLKTSSLLILLYGLSMFKINLSHEDIKIYIEKLLTKLGLNINLMEETYEITLIRTIIVVKSKNLTGYDSKIKKLLEILPLFEEEKILIDI